MMSQSVFTKIAAASPLTIARSIMRRFRPPKMPGVTSKSMRRPLLPPVANTPAKSNITAPKIPVTTRNETIRAKGVSVPQPTVPKVPDAIKPPGGIIKPGKNVVS